MTYKGLSIQGRGVVEYREWRGWPDIDIPLPPIATGVRVVTVTVVTPEGVTRMEAV